ncbi:hypothetical protein [Actinoplanes flavus]|uniref:Uncharacterized protein n=1 Tax=Actinoplanes flavus TaxID=2820290 RepID=A0ABS3UVS6_9ACTN|nr:hypothetical protein [Actinoplanes flavus]MBO3742681.1 hypothetical protein [Actinoplanes flavus]
MKTAILTMTLCLTAVVAGCSSTPAGPPTAASPTFPTTAPTTAPTTSPTTSPPTTSPAPTSPVKAKIKTSKPEPVSGTASARPLDPVPAPTDPECAPAVILPVAAKLVDDPAIGLKVEAVEIPVCRNGYARVFTVPARTAQRFEGDQLFLRAVDGAWKLVERGASIDCGDEGLSPAVAEACAALS